MKEFEGLVQMVLSDFEPTIAGKTHSEILSMKRWTRCNWYKTISSQEKEEAMRIVEAVRSAKISVATKGEKNPFYGKTHTEEHKAKISVTLKGRPKTKEHKAKISEVLKERCKDPEVRAKQSELQKRHLREHPEALYKWLSGGSKLPNKFEGEINKIFVGYNLPLFYTGRGNDSIINRSGGRIVPDFRLTDLTIKKVIETHGIYYHTSEKEGGTGGWREDVRTFQLRIAGYDCFSIWQHEVQDFTKEGYPPPLTPMEIAFNVIIYLQQKGGWWEQVKGDTE